MSSVPPLLALTESAQNSKLGAKVNQKYKRSQPPPQQKYGKKKETLAFNEDARREYLTGFSKRKKLRKQAAHDFVQNKIREELKNTRKAAAEARKQQAAENVEAERRAFGLMNDGIDGVIEDPLEEERDFETEERRAHVTIQPFDPDEDWNAKPNSNVQPGREYPEDDIKPDRTQVETLPPSSRRVAAKSKRVAPTTPSGTLTEILEPEVASAAQRDDPFGEYDVLEEPKQKKRAHTYLSAAERIQEHRKQREWNHTQAVKRRAENKARAKQKHIRRK